MVTQQYEALRERFGFDDWKGTNRLEQDLELHDVALPWDLIPGLDAGRVRLIDPGDGTRLLRASWTPPDKPDALLLLDIRECPSREAAHEVLLELLGNMQAPEVHQLQDAPGDVAFSYAAAVALTFARGNLAVSIANGGSGKAPVEPIARKIDDWIVRSGSGSPLPANSA
ncbi:hypothetical protein KK137_00345 [Croceibacterium sp. LX-88]|uniref:Uncharacterized protein n=1 Tax=Croceibacterium selenioxidans TaxID=2838833 RepID=A0ABS5VZ23_9SPHN|nr:hypothetical protein [Croceibacterium selenioxidans]MBT2132768.1 hypothetical protein [Croceibacterium selenioxidans]